MGWLMWPRAGHQLAADILTAPDERRPIFLPGGFRLGF